VIQLHCPACDRSFDVPDVILAGRASVSCPLCSRTVVIEGPARAADDAGAEAGALSLPQDRRISIAILSGTRKGDVLVLEAPRVVLGRSGADADLQIPDIEMSRLHAAVECHGRRVVLRDLGSSNGTFVGSERIEARQLEPGAEFRLGVTTFMLVVADA